MPSTSPVKSQARNSIIILLGIGGLAGVILTTIVSMMIVQQFLNPFDTSTINSVIVTIIIILTAWFAHKKMISVER
jgi:fluoride ion exporter CrcB/FEX